MTPAEIRRRLNESLARLGSQRKAWEQAKADHRALVDELKSVCKHKTTSDFVATGCHERTCSDCGRVWEL